MRKITKRFFCGIILIVCEFIIIISSIFFFLGYVISLLYLNYNTNFQYLKKNIFISIGIYLSNFSTNLFFYFVYKDKKRNDFLFDKKAT